MTKPPEIQREQRCHFLLLGKIFLVFFFYQKKIVFFFLSTNTFKGNSGALCLCFLDNSRITIIEVAFDVGISLGSYQAICTDVLGMKRAAVKIVVKLLNLDDG